MNNRPELPSIRDYITDTIKNSHRVIPENHQPKDQTYHCMEPDKLMNLVAKKYFNTIEPMDPRNFQFAMKELLEEGKIKITDYQGPKESYEVIALCD